MPDIVSPVTIPTASVLLSLSQVSEKPHSNGLDVGLTRPDQVLVAAWPVTG